MKISNFSARLLAFLALVVVAATAAGAWLWTAEQKRRLQQAEASHASFVLTEVKAALEARLNLGLTAAELPQTAPLLDGARTDMPAILSVAVLDEGGAVLFSTSPVEVGEIIAGLPAGRRADAIWTLRRDGERLYGIDLMTSFDTVAGAVVLRRPDGMADGTADHFALRLAIGGLAAAVPLTILAFAAGLRVTRGPRHAVATLADMLEGMVRDGGTVAPGGGEGLGVPLAPFAAAAGARRDALAVAEHEITRLDEQA